MAEGKEAGAAAVAGQQDRDKHSIFSKEALDKMRSPEKLDVVLPITTPVGWMGLVAVALMMVAVVIWSVFGSFTVKAEGMGLIMDPKGVVKVSAGSSGTIDDIYIHSGALVKKGDRLAHVDQAKETASTHMAQYATELAADERDAVNKVYEFDSRRYQQDATEYIYATCDGVVDEILAEAGSIVSPGVPICNIRVSGGRRDLQGVLYVPVDKGKRIQKGQTIQLSPNGADIAETGSLLGTVRSVSQYPVSLQAVQKRLGNEHLAQWIVQSQQSAVMEVTFDLVKDDSSESGYLWTSRVGEHKPVTPGSFCQGSVIIERRPPIEKVFYKLSQWLRNR